MVKVASGFSNFLSLTHLNLYEGGGKQRAPPMPREDYTVRVEVVHCDDGWQVMRKRLVKLKIL